MLIGIDGLPLAQARTGVGHYTFELALALAKAIPADDFQLVSPQPFDSGFKSDRPLPPNLLAVEQHLSGIKKHWWTIGLPAYLNRTKVTLFHGTNYDVPLRSQCPTVLTIHDLSSYLYPETHTPRMNRRALYRLPIMARRARMVITPSIAVRNEVCNMLPVKPEKVVAIPHAARCTFRPMEISDSRKLIERFGIDESFLLFVGTLEPRKNLLTLVKAVEAVFRHTDLRPQLVIAGTKGWLTDELFAYLETYEFSDRVRWLGYVAEKELCALYSACRIFVYPSIYEGFGLPPLEAMACGAPVITSGIPAIAETVGNAACLIASNDIYALSHAIIQLWNDDDRRKGMSEAGRARAAEFSWDRTARLTYEVYLAALGMVQSQRRQVRP